MVPMARPSIQSPLASSTTLWAQASKEWVIPAKPKPGRKPKKDVAPPSQKDSDEVDNKGRRVQNRAAQRAFRERKQSQLADLQARVQSFEQGEIERNVALQNIAKKLKDENDVLRKENASLRDEVDRLKKERDRDREALREREIERNNKRWREEESKIILNATVPLQPVARKRFRADTNSPSPMAQVTNGISFVQSPPSLASTPDSNGNSVAPYSPLPFMSMSQQSHAAAAYPGSMQMPDGILPSMPSAGMFPRSSKQFDETSVAMALEYNYNNNICGLCTEITCVCRDFPGNIDAMEMLRGSSPDFKLEEYDSLEPEQDRKPTIISIPSANESNSAVLNSNGTVCMADLESQTSEPGLVTDSTTPSSYTPSILDNLPAYQPPVPLPRRNAPTAPDAQKSGAMARLGSIFQIRLPSPESAAARMLAARHTAAVTARGSSSATTTPVCSGDPSNCMACKDDDFGKAFCRALGDSMCSQSPCATCPNNGSEKPAGACCGGAKCGGGPCGPPSTSRASKSATALSGSGEDSDSIKLSPAPGTGASQGRNFSASSDTSQFSASSTTIISSQSTPSIDSPTDSAGETIPTSEAWRQLKLHPHIAFADLSMLADVVARRTKCTGPVAVIHPPPGSLTPERQSSPATGASTPAASGSAIAHTHTHAQSHGNLQALPSMRTHLSLDLGDSDAREDDSLPVLLTDPHAHYHEQQRSRLPPAGGVIAAETSSASSSSIAGSRAGSTAPPSLVPQEELRQCGRARLREVDAAGVREALRILDAQFGRR